MVVNAPPNAPKSQSKLLRLSHCFIHNANSFRTHEKIKLHFKISLNILKEKQKKLYPTTHTMPQNKFQMDQLSERTNEAIEVLEENMKEFLMTLEWQRLV